MGRITVDTFLAAHRGQMPDAAWQKRKEGWTYAVSERGWTETVEEIALGNPMCIYVAEDPAGILVGLAFGFPTETDPQIGEIGSLYVHATAQGHGVGRRLVQAVVAHLAPMGITALQIAVLAANTPARQFYEAIGGQPVGERKFDEEGFLLPEVVYGWPDIGVLLVNNAFCG